MVVLAQTFAPATAIAATGINRTVNYQGRLLNASGAVIADGNYNMEFKIYQDGPGNVAGDTGGTLKWTEDWLGVNSQAVTVKNGYFSVPLGTINAFASQIDWNQDTLWLSQTVVSGANATSTSCTTFALCNTGSEPELLPMKRLSSSVYALNAGQLGGLTSSQYVQLAQGIQTDSSTSNPSIAINKTGATANVLQLQRAGADVMTIDNNGSVLFRPASDSGTAFQVQAQGGAAMLTADTTNKILKVGSSTTGADLVVGPAGTHLMSDGFETGSYALWHPNGSPVVDTAQARTGKYAAKITTSASQQSSFWTADNDTGYTTLYTRGYYYATAHPAADTVLFYLSDSATHQVQVIRKASTGIIAIKYDNGAVTSNAGNTVFALNGWHKLELETKVSTGGVGVYKIWYDGTQLFNVTNATAGTTTNLTEFQLGSDATTTQTFWADDVTIDSGSRPTSTDSSGLIVSDSIAAGGSLSVAGPTALTGTATINNQLFIGQNAMGSSSALADVSMTESASLYWGGFYTGSADHWRSNALVGDIGVVLGIQNGGLSYKLATAGSNPADTTLTTKQVLNVKPAQVELGQAGASGQTGVLVFNNTGTTNAFTIQGGGSGSAVQTWNLPTATATAAGQCITSSASGATQNLTWAGCANTALSNLASVAINTALNFVSTGAGAIGFNAAATAAGNTLTLSGQTAGGSGNAGGGVIIQGGTGTTTGAGGDLTLQGGTSGTGATGSVIVKSNTNNSAGAFQVQNASGTNLLNVSTLTTGNNLVTNPSFETSSTGWIAKGAATIAQSNEVAAQYGLRELKISTTAAAGDGATYTFPFTASGTYSLSFWAKSTGSTGANISFGHRENTTSGDVACLSAQTLTTTWTQYTCSNFTANATVNDTAPTMGIFVKQTDATGRTIYIDGVTLTNTSTALSYTLPGSELSVEGYYNNLSINPGNNGEIQPWKLNPTNISAARSAAGTAFYNGYIYLVGGGTGADGASTVNTVLYAKVNADGTVGSWTTNANNLVTGVAQVGATVAGGYIYVAGGQTTGGTSSTAISTVQYAKLNPDGSTGVWKTTSSLVNAVGDASVFSYNGYIYAVAGINTAGSSIGYTQIARIGADGTLGAWVNNTPTSDITATGIGTGYAIANGYVYKVGSGGASGVVNIGKLNTDGTITWSATTVALPGSVTMNDMGITTMNGYLYIAGGFLGSPTNDASTGVYYAPLADDGTVGGWVTSAATLPIKREYPTMQAINGYLYSIGGDNNSTGANTVYYASGARTKISGALDLVGGSGKNLSEGNSGGQLTAGDTLIVGSLKVQSAAEFARSLSIGDTLTAGSLGLAGGGTTDITTPGTSLTVQPGIVATSNGTGAAATLKAGDESSTTCGTACTGGALTLQGGSATGGSGTTNGGSVTINPGTGTTANGAISLGTLTTGITLNLAGGATATGKTDTINIATGNTAGTGAKTVHIADGTPAGSGVNSVTIGSLGNASVTTIQGGTGNISLVTNQTGAGTIVKATSTSTNNLPLLVQQTSTGDSGLEVRSAAKSYYAGIDATDGLFKISAPAASNTNTKIGVSDETTLGGSDSNNNIIACLKTTNTVNGTVNSASAFIRTVDSAAPRIRMLVYADSSSVPTGAPIASGASATAIYGWNTFSLSGAAVTASTTYWVCLFEESSGTTYADQGGGSNMSYMSLTYTTGAVGSYSQSTTSTDTPAFYMNVTASGGSDFFGGALMSMSDLGQATFKSAANSTSAFQIQDSSSNVLVGVDSLNTKVTVGGNLVLAARTDSGGTTSDWAVAQESAAGTPCNGQTGVDTMKSSVVFNGTLYMGTSEANAAEVCRYNGFHNQWVRVNSAAGTFGSQTLRDSVSAMTVYNGYLYIGVTESNAAAVYRYDGGSTFTLVNSAVGTFNTTTSVDGVTAMAVFQGSLVIGTTEPGASQVLRYNGGTTWTRMNNTAGTYEAATGMDTVSAMAVYNNSLYIGTAEPNAASGGGVFAYVGGFTSANAWATVGAPGAINNDTGTDEVSSMVVYNGALYISIAEIGTGNAARILKYYDQDVNNPYFEEINSAAGTFGAQTNVDYVKSMAVYSGRLYIGTQEANKAGVYLYDNEGGFTLTNSTAGTMQFSTNIDGITTLIAFNDKLWAGTTEANLAEIYNYSRVEGQSRALQFNAASDNAGTTQLDPLPNQGTIFFTGEQNGATNIQGASGTFVFSHGIVTSTAAYDVAEDYPTRDDSLKAGDLISIDPSERGFVRKASGKYDSGIVGVYSANPALHLSQTDGSINGGRAIPVALAGRVPLRVNLEGGAITPGDPLTSSSTPGVAMKARGAGRIVGMAMESFDSETEGSITVFVNPNFYSGVAGLQGATQTSGLIVDGTLATKDLSVSGTATIKTLDVAEIATIRTLNVSDTATVTHLVATAGVSTDTLDVKSTANLESVVVATNIELGGGIVKTFTAETALTAGQTVIATPDGHVTTTTTPADTRIVGIVLAAAEAHQPVKILIGGTAQVLIDGPATPGDLLGSSAVEGKATRLDPPKTGALLGKLLSPPDAQGRALVLISLD